MRRCEDARGSARRRERRSSAPRTPSRSALAKGPTGRVRYREHLEEALVPCADRIGLRSRNFFDESPLTAELRPFDVELEREQSEEAPLGTAHRGGRVRADARGREPRQQSREQVFADGIETGLSCEEVRGRRREDRMLLSLGEQALGKDARVVATHGGRQVRSATAFGAEARATGRGIDLSEREQQLLSLATRSQRSAVVDTRSSPVVVIVIAIVSELLEPRREVSHRRATGHVGRGDVRLPAWPRGDPEAFGSRSVCRTAAALPFLSVLVWWFHLLLRYLRTSI